MKKLSVKRKKRNSIEAYNNCICMQNLFCGIGSSFNPIASVTNENLRTSINWAK